ncbi:hypothetical protein T4D_4533, partial [Trichinella pseudospiralis]
LSENIQLHDGERPVSWKIRRRSEAQPAAFSVRKLLLGGICGHMRALCLKESVQWHGGMPQWTVKNVWFFEGENSSGAERVKSHGQYWVGRDKIVHNLLEGTRYRGIEMRAKMASGKGALGIMIGESTPLIMNSAQLYFENGTGCSNVLYSYKHPPHKNDAQSSEESGWAPSETFYELLVQNCCRTLWRIERGQRSGNIVKNLFRDDGAGTEGKRESACVIPRSAPQNCL